MPLLLVFEGYQKNGESTTKFFKKNCPIKSKEKLDKAGEYGMMRLSKTLELVPAVMGDFYLLGLPKDSSGCEAGSYLQGVETSLSAF